MPQKIVIASDTLRVNAELNDTDTAQAIIAALPIAGLSQHLGATRFIWHSGGS